MSKAKKQFYFFSVLYIVLTFTDSSLTYIGTPDLSREANYFVRELGYGWLYLIGSNVVSNAFFALIAYYVFVRFKCSVIPCENFRQYLSMLSFNRPDKFAWTLYKFPSSKLWWVYLGCFLGLLYLTLDLAIRIVSITEWIGVLTNSFTPLYIMDRIIRAFWPFELLETLRLVAIPSIIGVVSLILWLYYKYKKNKKALLQLSGLVEEDISG